MSVGTDSALDRWADMRSTVHVAGILVLLAGWVALVGLAIESGHVSNWPVLSASAVGAALVLFLALLLVHRLRAIRRGDLAPRRVPTHRR